MLNSYKQKLILQINEISSVLGDEDISLDDKCLNLYTLCKFLSSDDILWNEYTSQLEKIEKNINKYKKIFEMSAICIHIAGVYEYNSIGRHIGTLNIKDDFNFINSSMLFDIFGVFIDEGIISPQIRFDFDDNIWSTYELVVKNIITVFYKQIPTTISIDGIDHSIDKPIWQEPKIFEYSKKIQQEIGNETFRDYVKKLYNLFSMAEENDEDGIYNFIVFKYFQDNSAYNILQKNFLVVSMRYILKYFKNHINNIPSEEVTFYKLIEKFKEKATLTDSEVEVLDYLIKGLSNDEIAKKRFVSVKTISNQITPIKQNFEIIFGFDHTAQANSIIKELKSNPKIYFQKLL